MTSMALPGSGVLRVLIADESEEALDQLRAVLEERLGHDVVSHALAAGEAAELIEREDPDLSIVMVHRDDDHALRLISAAVECSSGPVIAHLGRESANGGDGAFAARAADHGVSALLGPLDGETLQAAIEVAIRRHRERARLSDRVDELEAAIERRATIERAKGILMERHSVDDRAAFGLLRDRARSQGRRVAELAAAVVDGHALLPPR
jgi:AmiR/NasT family two-component response regulator